MSLLLAAVGWSTTAAAQTVPTVFAKYGGGPILHPNIVTLYWGPSSKTWSSLQSTMQTYLRNLALYASGSTAPQGQEPTIYQYGVRGATLSSSTYADTTVPTNNGVSGHTTRTGVAAEIARLQGIGKLPAYTSGSLFMVFTTGITFDDNYGISGGWCGWHGAASTAEYFSVVPYPSVGGCGSGGLFSGSLSALQAWESATSHEFQEAATDPKDSGSWTVNVPGGEIGDECNLYSTLSNTAFPTGQSSFPVQLVVDNLGQSCSTWTTEQSSPISVVRQLFDVGGVSEDQVDVLALFSDHSIRHIQYKGSTWGSWTNLGATFTSAPVATVQPNSEAGTVDVFVQGTNNSLYHKEYIGGAWQASWDHLGGTFMGPVAVTRGVVNNFDFFVLGLDANYYHSSTGGAWTTLTWTPVAGIGPFNGPPAATALGNVAGLAGWRINGTYAWQEWPNATSWTAIQNGVFIGNPTLIYSNSNGVTGEMDIFGQGTDYAYYHSTDSLSQGQFGPFDGPAGNYRGAPAALSYWSPTLQAYTLEVVGEGFDVPNGCYYRTTSSPESGQWSSLAYLNACGVGAAAMTSPLRSLALWTFVEGADHALWYSTGSGWSSLGGALQ